jgi:hypothetical protein
MSRTIEFQDDRLLLHLSGLTSVAALKKEIEIPYNMIESVTVEDFEVPLLQFRVGTSVADIREGRFLMGGDWCFISYEDHNNVVVVKLKDHNYGKIIFQINDPEDVKEQILKRAQQ